MPKNPQTATAQPTREHSPFGDATASESADAFSVEEFCRRHSISRAHFYNLAKAGRAPRAMQVGGRGLISREAAAEWRRQMEAGARAA